MPSFSRPTLPVIFFPVLLSLLFNLVQTAPLPRAACEVQSDTSSNNPLPGALLKSRLSAPQRDAIFWTSISIAVLVSFVQGAINTLADICETEGLWTVRFSLSCYEHWWWTGIAASLIVSFGAMVISFLAGNTNESLGIILLAVTSSIAVFRFAWPAWRNRHYCMNRWAAWTGPSRTGVDTRFVPLLGNQEAWRALSRTTARAVRRHPVDIRPTWFSRERSRLIDADPTDLLKEAIRPADGLAYPPTSRLTESVVTINKHPIPGSSSQPRTNMLDAEETPEFPNIESVASGTNDVSHPTSDSMSSFADHNVPSQPAISHLKSSDPIERAIGVYAPIIVNQSVSLQWGEALGFLPRVSRGIITIPRRLLVSNPTTDAGHDGRPVCLAHGILGRNKGLAPRTFILKVDVQRLEENSVQWPRPSKVLRGYYEEEMSSTYGSLGDNYVTAATQLALILADSNHSLIADWLAGHLEQQDYDLNRQIHRLGASPEELELLYRLSYAAMLVSLSTHALGRRMRPEMSLLKAYWLANGSSLPAWAETPEIETRLEKERIGLPRGIDLNGSIAAVLSLPIPKTA